MNGGRAHKVGSAQVGFGQFGHFCGCLLSQSENRREEISFRGIPGGIATHPGRDKQKGQQ